MRLSYNHLRYFHAVARAGGLTRAAEQLNVAPSALSASLGKLEAELGHKLFDRVGRGLQLTEAGQIAFDHAARIFATGEALLGTLGGTADAAKLSVGAVTTLSRNFQLEWLRPVLVRDDVALTVRSGNQPELLAALDAHELDVVLTNRPPPRDAEALVAELLADQPVSLVGAPSAAAFLWPRDLNDAPVLLPGADSFFRQAFERIVERLNLPLRIAAEVDDMAMLRLLAREGHALALVPPVVVRDELASGVLVEHARIEGVNERFYAVTRKRSFPNPLLKELLTPLP